MNITNTTNLSNDLDWKTMGLSENDLEEICDKTERFIWKTTEDRVSGPNYSPPYWSHRMKWVNMLMEGRIIENETKNKIICTINGKPLTFEYIIESGLYKYCVCIFEIDRWIREGRLKGEDYDINYVLELRRKASNTQNVLTKDEKNILNKVFYDGTSILECFSEYFRIFKKRSDSPPIIHIDGDAGGSKKNKRKKRKTRQKKINSKKRNNTKTKKYYT